MRRTVILVTLTLLLLAVAGVTFAGETTFGSGAGDRTESTAPEQAPVATTVPEATQPESTVTEPDDTEEPGGGKAEDDPRVVKIPKDTGADEPGPGHPGTGRPETKGPAPVVEKARVPGKHAATGRPAGVGKPDDAGRSGDRGKPAEKKEHGVGRPENAGMPNSVHHHEAGERDEPGRGQEKVTLCHKDKVTITIGAPARDAHMRHGDSEGACG